jgi:hypothetical protein
VLHGRRRSRSGIGWLTPRRECSWLVPFSAGDETGARGGKIDVPLALAIVGLGILIVIAPSSVPGLTPPV